MIVLQYWFVIHQHELATGIHTSFSYLEPVCFSMSSSNCCFLTCIQIYRGWDGWMASPTQQTWVWINSGSWWRTGRPGMLQSMGSQSWTWLSDWTELRNIIAVTCIIVNCIVATLTTAKNVKWRSQWKNTNTAWFHLHDGSIVKLKETQGRTVDARGWREGNWRAV